MACAANFLYHTFGPARITLVEPHKRSNRSSLPIQTLFSVPVVSSLLRVGWLCPTTSYPVRYCSHVPGHHASPHCCHVGQVKAKEEATSPSFRAVFRARSQFFSVSSISPTQLCFCHFISALIPCTTSHHHGVTSPASVSVFAAFSSSGLAIRVRWSLRGGGFAVGSWCSTDVNAISAGPP